MRIICGGRIGGPNVVDSETERNGGYLCDGGGGGSGGCTVGEGFDCFGMGEWNAING